MNEAECLELWERLRKHGSEHRRLLHETLAAVEPGKWEFVCKNKARIILPSRGFFYVFWFLAESQDPELVEFFTDLGIRHSDAVLLGLSVIETTDGLEDE